MGLIAIGDIHGCERTLEALLNRLGPTEDDHLIFIGDYIDRGPDSKGVIDRLLALQQTHHCTFLRGNHEALMLDFIDEDESDLWSINGGVATLGSYIQGHDVSDHADQPLEVLRACIPDAHIDFVRQTELYYDTPAYFFVHAGLKPYLTVSENMTRDDETVFLWERSHLEASYLAWEKTVVCGHTPKAEPINRDRLINIDTGCVYYKHYHLPPGMGRLTAVRLPEREFVMIECIDEW